MATTTNKLEFLHHYIAYPESYSKSHQPHLAVADKIFHLPCGEGYLKVCTEGGSGFCMHVQVFLYPDTSCYYNLP
jgi:hypothetical protein